ncbi:GlpM family protein [Undibacterium sp. CY18W]|uniref:GlpM family protein n=1 Tax=Undibacterium hunanense TaxID=2762292 RepID=A0ABR6ZYV9_9BURK|nr:GlpM family protein [Undibacterium hunanense]MBC3920828.1 GlpM family protein [Undibacterium hunanense]
MIALLLKCLLGALAVLLIALASKSRYFVLAGLVPLFPTFALIAHFVVGTTRPATALQTTALFGLWSLFPYAVYLFAVYWLSTRTSIVITLGAATGLWACAAAIMLTVWFRCYPTAG